MILPAILLLSALTSGMAARAAEVVVEGRAPIGPEGLAAARDMAVRRALAQAAQSHSARISAQSHVTKEAAFETAQVNASACARDVQPLAEQVDGDELRVTLKVRLDACETPEEEIPACANAYVNRLVVTGFALEFPEQLTGEWDGRLLPRTNQQRIETLTATELARALERGGHVRAVFEGNVFPYASPSRAPLLYLPEGAAKQPVVVLAQERQAQYVLSGVYRAFGLEQTLKRQTRPIEIEAFVHDGANGAVLARRRFQAEVRGPAWSGSGVSLRDTPTIGTHAFRATPLGQEWTALIEKVARWAGAQASCLPFIARVMKVEGRLLELDAGAESRMSLGDTLTLHILREPPVFDLSARLLGQEKQVRATVLIRAVYPAFSIAELIEAPKELDVHPGDFVYAEH
jgi:hypothetical protein